VTQAKKGIAMRLNDQVCRLRGDRWFVRCVLASFTLLVLLAAPAPAEAPMTKGSFTSGGRKIAFEQFQPSKKGQYPAVVLLHGVDGLHAGNQAIFQTAARVVANKGFVVLLIHYHDRTGTRLEEALALRDQFCEFLQNPGKDSRAQKALRELFTAWASTVRDAVAHLRAQPQVNGDRVGLVGISLGGFLAAAVATEADQRIAAVVTLFGGIPRDKGIRLEQFPPALVIAGDKDEVVSVKESQHLLALLRARKLPCAEKIYKGVGHVFMKDGRLDFAAVFEAQMVIGTFLDKHLAKTAEKP
jgi:dienelactone hydrolase